MTATADTCASSTACVLCNIAKGKQTDEVQILCKGVALHPTIANSTSGGFTHCFPAVSALMLSSDASCAENNPHSENQA